MQYALKALRRDFDRVFTDTAAPGGRILLTINDTLPAEQYTLTVDADTLLLSAADDLGFVYGLFEISRRFLGVQPFWFWNDQPFTVREGEKIPVGTVVESKSYKVKIPRLVRQRRDAALPLESRAPRQSAVCYGV